MRRELTVSCICGMTIFDVTPMREGNNWSYMAMCADCGEIKMFNSKKEFDKKTAKNKK